MTYQEKIDCDKQVGDMVFSPVGSPYLRGDVTELVGPDHVFIVWDDKKTVSIMPHNCTHLEKRNGKKA